MGTAHARRGVRRNPSRRRFYFATVVGTAQFCSRLKIKYAIDGVVKTINVGEHDVRYGAEALEVADPAEAVGARATALRGDTPRSARKSANGQGARRPTVRLTN